MLRPLLILSIFCVAAVAHAQSCRIEPIGKPMQTLTEGERALDAVINPISITEDGEGNIYFIDRMNIRIRKVGLDGMIQTVGGNGQSGSDGDGGLATNARIQAESIAVTPSGIVYLSGVSHTIRRIGKDGIIQTIAGTGNPAFNFESGPALSVHLNNPIGLHYGWDGNLYFADQGNNRVRKLTPDGQMMTVAGSILQGYKPGQYGFPEPDDEIGNGGPATDAFVPSPSAVFLLPDGQLAIQSARRGTRLRIVDQKGILHTLFGPTSYSNLQMSPEGELVMSSFWDGELFLYKISLNGDESRILKWPPEITKRNEQNGLTLNYSLLPSGRLAVTRSLLGTLNATLNVTSFGIWVADSQVQHIAGSKFTSDAIQEGPAANTYLPVGKVAFRSDGGFYLLDKDIVYLVDHNQQLKRVLGGGADMGDPNNKDPLTLGHRISHMAVGLNDELVALIHGESFPRVFLRVHEGIAQTFRVENGMAAVDESVFYSRQQTLSIDGEGTIFFVVQKSSGDSDVLTFQLQGKRNKYTVRSLNEIRKMPDGRVIASVNSGVLHYHLTPTALGERVHSMDGVPGPRIAFQENSIYVISNLNLGSRFILRRSISDGAWDMLPLSQFSSGPRRMGEFLGKGKGNTLIISEENHNFWKISNPDSCSYIPGPRVKAASLVNSANYAKTDTISPGQLMTIFGENLGPAEGHGQYSDPYGGWTNSPVHPGLVLGIVEHGSLSYWNTSLVFGNSNQMNVQVHFDPVASSRNFEAFIRWHGAWIPYGSPVSVTPTNPGLFVLNAAKDGPGAILNQNGSVNSTVNPALPGSIVSFYATGLGNYDIEQTAGYATPYDTLPRVKANVTLQIGGQPAEVVYAGGAPGLINGLVQINARIPEGVHGVAEVELQADGVSTSGTQRVTLAVQ